MKTISATTTLFRSSYGVLRCQDYKTIQQDRELLKSARDMAASAAAAGLIEAAFHDMTVGKFIGGHGQARYAGAGRARHHEIYDVSSDGRIVVLCLREIEGTKRYGEKTISKNYVMLMQDQDVDGLEIKAVEINKALVARHAKKSAGRIGDVINVLFEDLDKKERTAAKKLAA